VRTVAGRASDFFGPRAEGSAVGDRFFPQIVAGKPVSVVGDPEARHTFTFVRDFARALVVLGSTEEAWGRAWHVPNDETLTIRGFAERAYAAAGTSGRVKVTPPWALRAVGLFVPGARETVEMLYEFDEDFVVDDRAFRDAFGSTATPLDEALAETVAWWRAGADGGRAAA
jgi:nucleoside-diphosphate-sugar epimerase